MKTEKIQKINWGYLLGYILGPILVEILCILVDIKLSGRTQDGIIGIMEIFGIPMAAIVWYILAGKLFLHANCKKLEKVMDAQGLSRNATFNSNSCTVCVDLNKGVLGLVFFWNPFRQYIIPASRLGKIWADDGAQGSGILKGTMRVSFLFQLDKAKVRVNTFTSNRKWRMDSDEVLEGISKADKWVEVLEEAKRRAG